MRWLDVGHSWSGGAAGVSCQAVDSHQGACTKDW